METFNAAIHCTSSWWLSALNTISLLSSKTILIVLPSTSGWTCTKLLILIVVTLFFPGLVICNMDFSWVNGS